MLRGMRKATMIVVLGGIVLACSGGSETPAPGATPAVPGAPGVPGVPAVGGAAPSASDDRAVMINAYRLAKTRKMRARATMVVASGPSAGTSSWVAEMVPPDVKKMVMTLPTGQQMHMLVAGPRVWNRMSESAPWMPLPLPNPSMDMDAAILRSIEDGSAQISREGPATLDGRPMTTYRVVSTAPVMAPGAGPGSTVTGRSWIGADGLAYKFEGDMVSPAAHVTITYEYDDSITIDVPR